MGRLAERLGDGAECMHCYAQYEDPTDTVQLIRERIELQRAVKLPWLADLAASTAKAIAAGTLTATNGSHPSSEVNISPCMTPR